MLSPVELSKINLPKARGELNNFLGVLDSGEVEKYRLELLAGHVVGWCFMHMVESVYCDDYIVGCFSGLVASVHKVRPEVMFGQAGHRWAETLELEELANYVSQDDKPADNKVLAMVLSWVEEFQKEQSDVTNRI
jgi:hypothetical protein